MSEKKFVSDYPHLVAEWHPTKNGNLKPNEVRHKSHKNYWWICSIHGEFSQRLYNRTSVEGQPGCVKCGHIKIGKIRSTSKRSSSLASMQPELMKEWDYEKNIDIDPYKIYAGAGITASWVCVVNPEHRWSSKISNRTSSTKQGCPYCAGRRVSSTNSLAALYPDIARSWHPSKNTISANAVMSKSSKVFWWQCTIGHEWEAPIIRRTGMKTGCPYCSGRKVNPETSLAMLCVEIAKEWSDENDLKATQVSPGSGKKVKWVCQKNSTHKWEAVICNRTSKGQGCPYCNSGWTLSKTRLFVQSLGDAIEYLEPQELWVLFQQSGILESRRTPSLIVRAMVIGKISKEELKKFADGVQSEADEIIDSERLIRQAENLELKIAKNKSDVVSDKLPSVSAKAALQALESVITVVADEEAAEFLVASAKHKVWKHTFREEGEALAELSNYKGGEYGDRVRDEFLKEYQAAKDLKVPKGYAFSSEPNLMQKLIAVDVRDRMRVGNWSGTGAGKTLSAILASRVVKSKLTVITCPNSVVENWKTAIESVFPDSHIYTKTDNLQVRGYTYVILNYEFFQQGNREARVKNLLEYDISFIVIDEIHQAKERDNLSRRREMINALVSNASKKNPKLRVLGMSATPLINTLQEGKSLVETIQGVHLDDLKTNPTIDNCMKLHQKLTTVGRRWMPTYAMELNERIVEVDCSNRIDEIKQLGKHSTLQLEQILTEVRLPAILKEIQPKTVIYTHFVEGIIKPLRDALIAAGWKVGLYTGEDKSGFNAFVKGDVDVLIGSSSIGTGVDGLQTVCSKLIFNVLPWTSAEFEQIRGRIYRQGQTNAKVDVVVVKTFAQVEKEIWSWCESKLDRIKFKKSIADAAVDGVIPQGHLRTPAQAYSDALEWLNRLSSGNVQEIQRKKIIVDLEESTSEKRARRYGSDFDKMNGSWNRSKSTVTHDRLLEDPDEWYHYHELYKEARKGWTVVPYEEMIRYCNELPNELVVGDFGCGEALLAKGLTRHEVYSFDHVAIDEGVIQCDMTNTGVESGILDVAVFSLSLMGSNITDYIVEARRLLKSRGEIHIVDRTTRFKDISLFMEQLRSQGFRNIEKEEKGSFTFVSAYKKTDSPLYPKEIEF